jgi:multiple sugar transport system substrate-binding protein
MISKYSENKKEAFEFVKFILREESQKNLYQEGAYLPVLSSIYDDKEYLSIHQDLIYDKELLDKGIHRPFREDYTEISDVISYYINQVLKNKISIETALENTNKSLKSGELILR